MSAQNLEAFLDFIEATGPLRTTKPDHVLNFATKHAYMWSRLWKNNGMPVAGGEDMRFWFVPRDAGTFEEVLPGSVTFPTNPQRLERGVVKYRFTRAHAAWNDAEVILNDKITYGTESAKFEQFVRLRDEKYVITETAIANGLEAQLVAVPDSTKMEGTSLTHVSPYSLFVFINEFPNGLPYTGSPNMTAGFPGAVWDKIEDISPAAASIDGQFSPKKVNYSTVTDGDPQNIIGGMDALWEEISWQQPDVLTAYQQDEVLNNQMYLTTLQGKRAYTSLIRNDQDRFVAGPQDPAYPDPLFRGIPIKRWDALETAAVYPNTANSALVTEAGTNAATTNAAGARIAARGPRFYAVNGNYLYPVAHSDRLMYKDKPIRHPNVPDTWAQYMATWWNLKCDSRKHQGILCPSTDLYTGLYT